MGNTLDKNTFDQVLSNNECLIGDINLIAQLGKSVCACIVIEVKEKLDFEYINRKQF